MKMNEMIFQVTHSRVKITAMDLFDVDLTLYPTVAIIVHTSIIAV